MDDESGWNAILVDGWGDLVRAAVCDRVADRFATSRGLLTIAATTPDDAPAAAVERVHDAVVAAIAAETGANLDELGSQAAWATYDDVWGELGRRWDDAPGLEFVPASHADDVVALLRRLPSTCVEHAGAVADGADVHVVRTMGGIRIDVEGVFRWLATEVDEEPATRERARQLVAIARGGL